MAERRKRRRFTAEFKAEAVKRLLEGGKGLSEAATELGISPGQLGGWRNEPRAAGSAEALAARKAEQAEPRRRSSCVPTSAVSSRPAGTCTARRGCTPSCAGRGGATRAGGS